MKSSTKSTAWITLLPAELLQIIFRFLYDDFIPTTAAFESGVSTPDINLSESDGRNYELEVAKFLQAQNRHLASSISPSLFPYNIAAVCETWKNVLSSSPAFWTRLVLFVDFPSTSVEDARRYIEWSRQLPIDVFILRRLDYPEEDTADNSQSEKEKVQAFIKILQPHIGRCRSLHIDVTVDSSLPPLSEIAPMDARSLRSLYLNCDFDSIPSSEDLNIPTEINPTLWSSPRLHTMALNAHSFLQACTRPPLWFIRQPQLRHLDVSGGASTHLRLSLQTTLDTITTDLNFVLFSLDFSNINFNLDTNLMEANQYTLHLVNQFSLSSIPSATVSELFRVCSFPRLQLLRIQDCAGLNREIFNNLEESPLRYLILSHPAPATDFQISDFLSGWSGTDLTFSVSNVPYSQFVDALAAPEEVTLSTVSLSILCPHVNDLTFFVCPLPSFTSIKKLIERRNHNVDYDDYNWWANNSFIGPAITSLGIERCWSTPEAPTWTQDERRWMRSKVPKFTLVEIRDRPLLA
ncbi:hypothetical protein GALMADRAFT_239061 [Galerina marginata CBS 339.88]|uniref:F-box domain-containing protein n=1 Tax=Galerina marginata (strain CBS 339.88) TaxID=685588 RepID=A0A067TW30_GALM3|nr:hypothetical protein GALMADRAFT_239061 [Galerina marginata CBS 339.88]